MGRETPNRAVSEQPERRKGPTHVQTRFPPGKNTCWSKARIGRVPQRASIRRRRQWNGEYWNVEVSLREAWLLLECWEAAHDCNKAAPLFNHLVRDGEYFVRNLYPECLTVS